MEDFQKPKTKRGGPVWELAYLFPFQGHWSEAEYLALNTNRLVELRDGCLEFLPMPTVRHQKILGDLLIQLANFVDAHALGQVLMAPLPTRLWPGRYCEPDILFFSAEHPERLRSDYPEGADLVMEIVMADPEDRQRSLEQKRAEYAQAGIAEYWIVDLQEHIVVVLTLEGEAYQEHGVFGKGERAPSLLLDGFEVDVTAVFAAAKEHI